MRIWSGKEGIWDFLCYEIDCWKFQQMSWDRDEFFSHSPNNGVPIEPRRGVKPTCSPKCYTDNPGVSGNTFQVLLETPESFTCHSPVAAVPQQTLLIGQVEVYLKGSMDRKRRCTVISSEYAADGILGSGQDAQDAFVLQALEALQALEEELAGKILPQPAH